MSKIVSIDGRPTAYALQPQPTVINALEELLAEAKAGRIQHLVAVFSDGVGFPIDVYVGTGEAGHVLKLIGGMELCKHTMLMSQFEKTTGSVV